MFIDVVKNKFPEVLQILFSKYALVFYFLVINIEFVLKYTISIPDSSKKLFILRLTNAGGILAIAFLIFYSYFTVWWCCIGLLIINVVLFITINSAVSFLKHLLSLLTKVFKSFKTPGLN
jgi:hypothetical protein